jgi:hypothetical protein
LLSRDWDAEQTSVKATAQDEVDCCLRDWNAEVMSTKETSPDEVDCCLRDWDAEQASVKATVRIRQSNSSIKSKPLSASLFSGASRTSAYRHALLKSSVSEAQAVDKGLPLSPALTFAVSTAEKPLPDEPKHEKAWTSAVSDVASSALQSPIVANLTNLQNAKELADNVKIRAHELSLSAKDDNTIYSKANENFSEGSDSYVVNRSYLVPRKAKIVVSTISKPALIIEKKCNFLRISETAVKGTFLIKRGTMAAIAALSCPTTPLRRANLL